MNECIDDFATGEYVVTRAARGRRVNGHYVRPSAWTAATVYGRGDQVTSDDRTWRCTVDGLSGSVAPNGDGPSFVDGSVTWSFIQLNHLTVVASVQPLSGKDLKDLPEGQRADEMRKMFVYVELLTRTADTEPDVVTIDGVDYRVDTVEGPWTMDDETHWNVTVAKVGRP